MLRRIGVATATIISVLIVVVVGLFVAYGMWLHPGYDPLPFSAVAWAEADAETRGYMSEDLFVHHVLDGKLQEEIVELLGDPDWGVTVAEMHDRNSSMGLDDATALTRFGENAEGRWSHVGYRLGYLGFREGAPFVFEYSLHVVCYDGRVTSTYIDD